MKTPCFLARADWPGFVAYLLAQYQRLIGPKVAGGAVVFAELSSADELPYGVTDASAAGQYRLGQSDAAANCFDWVSTAQGIKPWLFEPEEILWQLSEQDEQFVSQPLHPVSTVLLGARACDLAALDLLDRHFAPDSPDRFADPRYQARRAQLTLIAVNCHRALESCFCLSTGDGPQVTVGHDVVLDELDNGYLLAAGSERGGQLLERLAEALPLAEATPSQLAQAAALRQQAQVQQRALPKVDKSQISDHFWQAESNEALWQEVAGRCLTCGNCTAVCPSCFCFRVDNESTLDNQHQSQVRRWDSCFINEHSYLTGHHIVHRTPVHKYRQWLMHKLIYWQTQYGRPGCTGCGRCIIWCPAAIDLVEEAQRLSGQVPPANANSKQKATE